MKKLFQSKYGWIFIAVLLVAVNLLASRWHSRIDLTAEKRYTISNATRSLLRTLPEPVNITVFLEGDIPAGFKKLSGATRDMLQEFKEIAGSNVQYFFRQPGEGLNDSLKFELLDSLQQMGIHPTNVKAQVKKGEGEEQRLVYPGALVEYRDRVMGINLLQGQSSVDGLNSLNNAEALLEYKFAEAIDKIVRDTVPTIGYLAGNGQPQNFEVYDLIQNTLRAEYAFGMLPIDSVPVIPLQFDALLVVKPQKAFTDAQKLKLDQYVMHGGKIIWLIDNLYASLDSLRRNENNSFIAFDMGLNIDDLLFKYGVRINPDLVQDLNCTQIPMAVGMIGDRPQLQLMPWTYFPLLAAPNNNPVAKNLDYVMAQFPQSIDTVSSPGVTKTILLATSPNARTLSTPAMVELNSVKTEDDLKTFNRPHIPVAVLLEGSFSSLYANRVSNADKDSLAQAQQPFKAASDAGNKMIVIADADIVTNGISQEKGPLQMGENQFTNYKYANKTFIQNCLEYLVGNPGILETRAKDYTLRVLDKAKLDKDSSFWQLVNIGLPIAMVMLFAVIYIAVMKRRYQQ
ncbi:MAG: gliding motility-associated ABC transporter substrate-binding protein GldG [Chitinophagaceae bacterium]|nr:gliding motility-associated ABC transporter substrate-binding protein GldG [Chitinophagaceae bacterium]MCW5925484.1 gliding motility-associated ABC transporter substrate-binding protein GldG [Chitinophagaceae bacterium]